MGYLDENLLPGETIVFRTRKHPIIFFVPCVLALLTVVSCIHNPVTAPINQVFNGLGYSLGLSAIPHNYVFLFLSLLTVFSAAKESLIYWTSDYAVTDKRVTMKQGFFDRYASDIRLSTISHVVVDQGLIGQTLNYGIIVLNSFGGTSDRYNTIASPREFQKNVQEQLEKTAR